MKNIILIPLVVACSFVLFGCAGSAEHSDLREFIDETKKRPQGQVDPLPAFSPYEAFTYSASRLRNPFEQVVAEQKNTIVGKRSDVKPNLNRTKELLENYNFASLSMVGTFEKENTFWVLVDDGEGQVHYLKKGNYLGKNHGRVVAVNNTQIDVIEIVTDGLDGWVERPRSLKLQEKE
ncbi:MAG: pilus assembly protein PilP [Cellvibrionaceae bacterium]